MGQNVTGFISEIEWHIGFETISLKTYFACINRDIILEHNSILRNGIKSSRVKTGISFITPVYRYTGPILIVFLGGIS